MTDSRLSGPPLPAAPDRSDILAAVTAAVDRCACRWAWQGPAGSAQRWLGESGPKDLDLWYAPAPGPQTPAQAIAAALPSAVIAEAHDPRRLCHVSLAVETAAGPAVVDLSYGDLRVGPVLLAPADVVEVDPATHRLTGAAAVADLLVRPVLRGRLPEQSRLAEARDAWAQTSPAARAALRDRLATQLGVRVAGELVAAAGGAAPDPGLPGRARMRLAALSFALGNASATWRQRHAVLPAGPSAGPLGLRTRGVVVALVGTDGSGKSTVADGLRERLHRYGFATASAYFGMARGNLPGVGLARRLLGVPTVPAEPEAARPVASPPVRGSPGADRPPGNPGLRRAAAWFYAAEYVWRYLSTVAPARARRRVVIVDRWVYDLRESPWPGSPAARVAERVVPAPDVLVLPDAPAELIHRRKPERPQAEQAAQQERFRRLLAEHPARHAEVVVDTSGATADNLAPLVAAVVTAAHRPRRGPR
ncbi:thymidylate kinase [Krasilnikovia sp. M28-CT-15]|uniref:thymidylate kinase n=1 Tax=Krasilnikovia sp. M28-CT-15 TaxID=3373540 RepID=UPI0038774EB7